MLVVGADAASRVVDPSDRDSLIFADGAGAALVGAGDVVPLAPRCEVDQRPNQWAAGSALIA